MATIRRFENLQAWQKARELVRDVYKICTTERLNKDYGLKDQLRRAAVSSMSNIAEGFARSSDKDYAHFLDMAKGSLLEVQSLFYVSLDVGYIERDEFEKLFKLADETISLVSGFASYLCKSPQTSGS